eukprot:7803492-Ditylum_brightwellii.AAC.1
MGTVDRTGKTRGKNRKLSMHSWLPNMKMHQAMENSASALSLSYVPMETMAKKRRSHTSLYWIKDPGTT